MQLIILLLFHTRRIPGKNKSKRELQLIFIRYKYTENALVYFTPILVKIMCCAYFAMSQSLMVPNAEKTDRMSSSVRSRWMLARYNLKTRASNTQMQSTVIILNQPVVTLRLSHNFINAGLGLGHLARPSHLTKGAITGNLSILLKSVSVHFNIASAQNTLIFLPQTRIPFIWSRASCAASGCSNSTKAKPCRRKISLQGYHLLFVTSFSSPLTFLLDF